MNGNFTDVGMIPMTVEMRSFDEDGRIDSNGTFNITDLQINVAIDPALFRLNRNQKIHLLRFIRDGTGTGLYWEAIAASPSGAPPERHQGVS